VPPAVTTLSSDFALKQRVAETLLSGMDAEEAAVALCVTKDEVDRQRSHPAVRAVVQDLATITRDQVAKVAEDLGRLAVVSVATLDGLLRDPKTPAAVLSRTALEVIKLSGNAAPTKFVGLTGTIPDAMMEEVRKRAMGAGMGEILNVTAQRVMPTEATETTEMTEATENGEGEAPVPLTPTTFEQGEQTQ
jgi:hypothetical protein